MKDLIQTNLTSAMRDKNPVRLSVIRSLKSAITNAEKNQGDAFLSDMEVLQIIRKEISKRSQSMVAYKEANRMDLYDKEYDEQIILEEFLPEALTNDEVDNIILLTIDELGATSKKDMGRVIKKVVEVVEGRIDNKTISQKVAELLK